MDFTLEFILKISDMNATDYKLQDIQSLVLCFDGIDGHSLSLLPKQEGVYTLYFPADEYYVNCKYLYLTMTIETENCFGEKMEERLEIVFKRPLKENNDEQWPLKLMEEKANYKWKNKRIADIEEYNM